MKNIFTFLILIGAFVFVAKTWASPYPAMGSSILVNPEYGAFLTAQGYKVTTQGTSWIPIADLNENSFDVLRLQKKGLLGADHASLSVRIDEIPQSIKLDLYAKKWVKEYSQFGFEILGTKSLTLSQSEALIIDLVHKNQQQQVRQVLLQKDKKIAVFTCRDSQRDFTTTLPSCNQVVRSFEWR